MKRIPTIELASTAVLFLFFGTAAVAYAQQDQHGQESRPTQTKQEHQKQQQDRQPQQQPQRAQQQQQPQNRQAQQQPQRTQQQALGWQQQRGWLQQGGGWQGNSSWQQDRAQNWRVQHRTWDQRGGYGGYYIPNDRFALNFGSQHWFRIRSALSIVAGYPRFQYGGFWFMLLDPWPENWAVDWYASDDVYVDYYDGYYLYNRRYPGQGIAISVVMGG
jgi:hypothetical protein